MVSKRPVIGITLGDPAGIGPEVLSKALQNSMPDCTIVLYGARWGLELGARVAGVDFPTGSKFVSVGGEKPNDFTFGRVQARWGEIAVLAGEAAARDALLGKIDAMVTWPLNKEAIHVAGYDDIGHQEILARLSEVDSTATMLMTPGLRVVHLSTHKSLIDAGRYVTEETVFEKIRLCADTLKRWGMPDARIAVAALNPHGGEGGLLGLSLIHI